MKTQNAQGIYWVSCNVLHGKNHNKLFHLLNKSTVKLRYNRLAYIASSVITLASQCHHFSIQNMSVSTYMDITNPRLLQTDFGAKNLQWTPASMYVHPPSSQLTSVNNVLAVSVTLMPSACRPLPGCGVLIALLIAVNVGQIPLLRQFTMPAPTSLHSSFPAMHHEGNNQKLQLHCLIERRYSWWHIRVCNFYTSTNSWPFDTLAFFLPCWL